MGALATTALGAGWWVLEGHEGPLERDSLTRLPAYMTDLELDPEPGPEGARRVRRFVEKPSDTTGLEYSPGKVLASMGNYVFTADALAWKLRTRRGGRPRLCTRATVSCPR